MTLSGHKLNELECPCRPPKIIKIFRTGLLVHLDTTILDEGMRLSKRGGVPPASCPVGESTRDGRLGFDIHRRMGELKLTDVMCYHATNKTKRQIRSP